MIKYSVILLVFSFFIGTVYSNDNFYYSNGIKVQLTESNTKICLRFQSDMKEHQIDDFFAKETHLEDHKPLPGVPGFMTVDLKQSVDALGYINILKNYEEIDIVSPVYLIDGIEAVPFDVFIIKFKTNVPIKLFDEMNKNHHVKINCQAPSSKLTYYLRITSDSDLSVVEMAQFYFETFDLEWSIPDFVMPIDYFTVPNDPFFQNQYYLSNTGQTGGTSGVDIDVLNAWDITKGNSDITVAIIDQGISQHEDLVSLWTNEDEYTGDHNQDGKPGFAGVDDDGDGLIDEDSNGKQPGESGYLNDLYEDDDENGYIDDINGWDFFQDPDPEEGAPYFPYGDNNPSPEGNSAHGMACAGIVAASHNISGISGIAPNVKIMRINTSDKFGNGTTLGNLALAIDYAWANSADILSNSWGKFSSDPNHSSDIVQAITGALTYGRENKGSIVIFAAGNYARRDDNPPDYSFVTFPACVEGVIAVGSIDKYGYVQNYSPRDQELDLVAPSGAKSEYILEDEYTFLHGDIWTTDIGGSPGFNPGNFGINPPDNFRHFVWDPPGGDNTQIGNYTAHFGGTSAACPQVAGIVALILSINNTLTASQVETILQNSAVDIYPDTWDSDTGYGRVNAYRALKYTIEHYETTNVVSGTISSNTTWSGYKYVTGDVTVNSGVTLTINAGSVIFFDDDQKLTINGTLDAQGTDSQPIKFSSINQTPAPGDWYGLKVYGSATFDYCTIEYGIYGVNYYVNSTGSVSNSELHHNRYGIYTYQSSPNIQNCQIHDNSYQGMSYGYANSHGTAQILNNTVYNNPTGIQLYSSSPDIRNNEIYNCNNGIYCVSTSSPHLGEVGYYGYNNIHNNTIGLNALSSSNPFLGESGCQVRGGWNQIVSSSSYHLKANYYSNVLAENNWWGTNPPQENMFNKDQTSSIDNIPYLTSPPTLNLLTQSTPEEQVFDNAFNENELTDFLDTQSVYDENWTLEQKLIFARDIIYLGDIEFAETICKEILDSYPDSALSFLALDVLWEASRNENAKEGFSISSFKTYLSELIQNKNQKILYGYAEIVLASFETENWIEHLDNVYKEYYETFLAEASLLDKFMHYYNAEENKEMAETIFSQMEAEFPNSEFTNIAQSYFSATQMPLAKSTVNSDALQIMTSNLPDKYTLSANYPNPFNPSTTIEYALPKVSKIQCTIYNSIGQKIKEFNSSNQPIGNHKLTWDGKNEHGSEVPSGVYILSFVAKSLEGDQEVYNKSLKMILLK